MNYLPTCTSRLVVQYPCQVSFKSMQGWRRSWEDKLKCVKILSVKDHNSAKICRTWIISPQALLDLWCNIPTKFHLNSCKDVGGVRRQTLMGRNDGRTEWRNDRRTDKANTKCPFAILWRGHKKDALEYPFISLITRGFYNYDQKSLYLIFMWWHSANHNTDHQEQLCQIRNITQTQ